MSPLDKYKNKLGRLSLLHKNLANYRKRKKLTQDEMAAILELPKGKYRSYEYGIAEPSLKKTYEISTKLGLDFKDLIINIIE
jgi:transcriptional regulator with XRE-family HTH domain